MAYNILGVNPGHNGSVALLSDGEIVYYVEEERLTRSKYDGNPFKGIMDVIFKWKIDEVVIAGTHPYPVLPWTGEDPYSSLVRKYYPKVKTTHLHTEHHLGHACCAFFNSGFDEALVLIVDGAGSLKTETLNTENNVSFEGYEAESVWVMNYEKEKPFTLLFKAYGNNQGPKMYNDNLDFDSAPTVTKVYEAVSHYLGFGFIEAGKTMGLSSYGKYDENIKSLFNGSRGSKNIFYPAYPAGAYIEESKNKYFSRDRNPEEWHHNPELLLEVEKNAAWHVQMESQKIIGDYIELAVKNTGIKKVAIAGGYGLNCVANYYFLKRFPDVEFYCEPIAHDGGTAIGVAKYKWFIQNGGLNLNPQNSIYYGPEHNLDHIQNFIDNEKENIEIKNVSYEEIADLISKRNIVAMFQGRSEAGPRALGNRSILYDPRDPDGKEFVNKVKGREWFRPFAGTVLKEDANDWFDMAGLEESPFMMFAVNVAADKTSQIPCITHVDDTCRVQTVTEYQNLHYYNLIKAFKQITGVPILFNTSFNLAGDPLVESIEDAFDALYRSKLKHLYLPELKILITKKIDKIKEDKLITL